MKPLSFEHTWSEAEKAALREHYPNGVRAAMAAIPGRTRSAIFRMAYSQGVGSRRDRTIWTQEESDTLARMWGWETIPAIAREVNKKPRAVAFRAVYLGLKMVVPEGYEYITDAAVRTGFSLKSFQRIMRLYRVGMRAHYGRSRAKRYHQRIVDSERADEAVSKYLSTENLLQAAQARGMDNRTLRTLLRAAGVKVMRTGKGPKALQRVRTEDLDRIAGEWRETEWMEDGAKRHGMNRASMRRLLIQAGIKKKGGHSVSVRVRKADVDAAVEAHRALLASTELVRDAAKRVGVGTIILRRHLSQAGFVRVHSKQRLDRELVDRAIAPLLEYRRRTMTVPEACELHQVSRYILTKHLRALGFVRTGPHQRIERELVDRAIATRNEELSQRDTKEAA